MALVRHNLHAASRSGEFGFFKTLQAAGFMEGTNHVASLSAELGDDADIVLAAMDNLNAGLAYIHQDAFKNVYENLKNNMRDDNKEADKSKLYVDITMQKNMADMAIDKMTSSALALMQQQPPHVQDLAANVWITGATIVADCIEIALKEIDALETKLDDFIRLDESWNTVKASVVCAVTGLKGVFRLMDPTLDGSPKSSPRNSSIASASGAMFRRLSNAFVGPPTSRSSSIASVPPGLFNTNTGTGSVSSMNFPVYRTPNYVRNSVSNGCPTSLPSSGGLSDFQHHKLSAIPPTPGGTPDDQRDPFDTSGPAVPEIPPIAMPALSMEQRRLSQAVM